MADTIIVHIEYLFYRYGSQPMRREPVTLLEHALQCAHLAEHAGADDALVAAALFHDLGHLLAREDTGGGDRHPDRVLPLLGEIFGDEVTEPIRLHVDAKRYLGAVDPTYLARLSPASRARFERQGGAFDAAECKAFAQRPGAARALLLRRWDDASHAPGITTPSLAHFLERARRCALVPA